MEILKSTESYQKDDLKNIPLPNRQTLLFDIETTGFSASFSFVYLIGCAYYENDTLYITQFFAESHVEEINIINAFIDYLKDFKTLVSFNGNGFDLPFLKSKIKHYQLVNPFEYLNSIDLYKHVLQLKKLLSLENYKQKTVEEFLGLNRVDKYSGKELIKLYESFEKSQDYDIKQFILLHNFDDIKGLFSLLSIQSYTSFVEGKFSIANYSFHDYSDMNQKLKKELLIELQVPFSFPQKAYKLTDYFHISLNQEIANISVYLTEGILKYFLPNYKDYYYLPEEDTAIHKSVAGYVDKKYRMSAKASTCYIKKEGLFAPQYSSIIEPCYKKDYSDPISYFEIQSSIDTDELYHYIVHLLNVLLH